MSSISTVCQVLRCVANGITLADDIKEAATSDTTGFAVPKACLKTAAFVLNTAAVGGQISGGSDEILEKITFVETAMHTAAVPVALFQAGVGYSRGDKTALQAIEEGFLTPVAGVVRSSNASLQHHYKHLLSLPPEERFDPVYRSDGDDSYVFDHYELLTEEQCIAGIQAAEENITRSSAVEIGGGLLRAAKIYQSTINQIAGQHVPVQNAVPVLGGAVPVVVPAVAPVVPANPLDPLSVNLLTLPFIPQALHGDVFFARYVCPITFEPIRHPVRDPNGVTLYERAEIIREIGRSGRSPVTRRPLTVLQLQPVPILQQMIDNRLTLHQAGIEAAIQAGAVVPPPQNVLTQVTAENPNY